MALTATGGGTRSRRRRPPRPIADINVTPLVDVMLVLLIVFMVTAPLLSAGVPVDLPQAPAKPLALSREPITVTIGTDGRIFVKDEEVTVESLATRLKAIAPDGADERIYVRGDKTASYGAIMKVMGTISGAGFTRIALVALTETEG